MAVTALNGQYRGSSRALGTDVDAVASLMGGCTFGSQSFWDTPTAAWEMAVQNWLTVEEDEGVLPTTADRIAFDEGGEGDATQGGGNDALDGEDSGDSDGGGSDASDGEGSDDSDSGDGDDSDTEASEDVAHSNDEWCVDAHCRALRTLFPRKKTDRTPAPYQVEWLHARGCLDLVSDRVARGHESGPRCRIKSVFDYC